MNNNTIIVEGSQSGFVTYQLLYNNFTKTLELNLNHSFFTGENVRVTLTSNIVSVNGYNIPGYTWEFKISSINGTGSFIEDTTLQAGANPTELVSADFNNKIGADGYFPDPHSFAKHLVNLV